MEEYVSTIYGTFTGNVMLIGDCNTLSTFQQFMTELFRDFIGKFLEVYLDDIFIYLNTIEDHQRHVQSTIDRLRDTDFGLNEKKCDFYSEKLDCLGHIINDSGIHADNDKMAKIRDWHTPRNYNDIEQFLGLVQYLQHFMPNVLAYMAPLSGMTWNGHLLEWRPIHQKCFEMIKALACKTPIL
jgi:hypothetical protein